MKEESRLAFIGTRTMLCGRKGSLAFPFPYPRNVNTKGATTIIIKKMFDLPGSDWFEFARDKGTKARMNEDDDDGTRSQSKQTNNKLKRRCTAYLFWSVGPSAFQFFWSLGPSLLPSFLLSSPCHILLCRLLNHILIHCLFYCLETDMPHTPRSSLFSPFYLPDSLLLSLVSLSFIFLYHSFFSPSFLSLTHYLLTSEVMHEGKKYARPSLP